MLPFFKVLKGLIGIDVSHFVDFYGNCDYYSFRHYDHLMLEKKYARTIVLIPLNILVSIQE